MLAAIDQQGGAGERTVVEREERRVCHLIRRGRLLQGAERVQTGEMRAVTHLRAGQGQPWRDADAAHLRCQRQRQQRAGAL